jgi:hypothetical protein
MRKVIFKCDKCGDEAPMGDGVARFVAFHVLPQCEGGLRTPGTRVVELCVTCERELMKAAGL